MTPVAQGAQYHAGRRGHGENLKASLS
jgi:hypothetical protein